MKPATTVSISLAIHESKRKMTRGPKKKGRIFKIVIRICLVQANCYGSMLDGTKHVKIFLSKQGRVLQKVTTAWLCHDWNRGQKKSEKQCIIVFGIPSPKCEKLLSYQVVNKKR